MYNFLLIDDYEGEIDSFKDTIEVLNKDTFNKTGYRHH